MRRFIFVTLMVGAGLLAACARVPAPYSGPSVTAIVVQKGGPQNVPVSQSESLESL